MIPFRTSLFAVASVVALTQAAPLFAQSANPVLTITQGDQTTSLSIDDLRAMDQTVFSTTTIWTEGTLEFTGVPLAAVLERAGASGHAVSVIALNDYAVEIPADGVASDYPIIAYLIDGQEFSPRDKGPLWIVYPYDADAMYRTDETYARSVWQLARIDVQN